MENNNDYIENCEKFDVYYREKIISVLQKQEKIRIKYLSILICLIAGIIIWCLLLGAKWREEIFSNAENISIFDWKVLPCFVILLICFPMFSYYKKSKENILPLIINFFGNFSYDYQHQISDSQLEKSKIIKPYAYIKTDDCFNGEFESIPITITEFTRYEQETYKENEVKKVRAVKKEHGILFSAKMNKNFEGQTIIIKDKGLLNKFTHYKNLQRVGLESPEFEKAYEVYSDNQIEARYILTTVMLEYLLELKQIFPKTEMSFFDEKVLLKINIKENLFECSSFFSSILNQKRIEKIFKQFYLLFTIIKIMRLNQEHML